VRNALRLQILLPMFLRSLSVHPLGGIGKAARSVLDR
jgi:hypothetical protein